MDADARRRSRPLFLNFDRTGKEDGRLSGSAAYAIVRAHGAQMGLTVDPHGFRNLAITSAIDLTKSDVRAIPRCSYHRGIRIIPAWAEWGEDPHCGPLVHNRGTIS